MIHEKTYSVGQLIAVVEGDNVRIGKIKGFANHGAFVNYHEGSTASLTPWGIMLPISNAYCIMETAFNTADCKEATP